MRALLFLTVVTIANTVDTPPTAVVTGGQIRGGLLEQGGAVFKGIPFAAPPTGDRRWREPGPVESWSGAREATAFSPPCAQNSGGRPMDNAKEDCLYLNVWTPEWPAKSRKPVMVWLHGGGNYGGTASTSNFNGEPLARHGVVLVTVNYRLTIFGFFAHPELTRESSHHASGNYGLMDQIAALKWVRENIGRFGGDPANVTIFGQSAGAVDANVLMASPLTRDLFEKAIGESGSVVIRAGLTRTRADLENAGVRVAGRLGAPAKGQIKFMRGLSATEVFKAAPGYNARNADRPEP